MPSTDSDGYELWYELSGSGDVIVVTGGFGLLHDQFEQVTPLLADRHRVVNWNWRGAGRSDRALSEPPSVEAWTRDLVAVLDSAEVERAVLWGTSTGALVSLHAAARHPERVRALVTYPSFKTDVGMRRAYALFAEVAEAFGYDAVTRLVTWVGLDAAKLDTPEGLAFARWERASLERNLPVEAWGPVCRAIAETDLTGDLARVAGAGVPVLLLAGDRSPVGLAAPPIRAQLEAFQAAAPHAELATIAGTGGTYCVLEDAAACVTAVEGFLARLS